jgi:hypothetical protein
VNAVKLTRTLVGSFTSSRVHLNGSQLVLEQRYENGARCPRPGRPPIARAAQVFFVCLHPLRVSAVVAVEESSLCQYQLIVHTPLLCSPLFRFPANTTVLLPLLNTGLERLGARSLAETASLAAGVSLEHVLTVGRQFRQSVDLVRTRVRLQTWGC